MTNYKEIIRLHSLGLNKTHITESCGCARSTVITALHKAEENGLSWNAVKNLGSEEVARKLYPATSMGQQYSMPDYEWVHKEMQKSGVTLSLLWVEYCERCRQNGELPYKSTQFNKYYADYVHKTKATMHLEHKPSENLQVDWAGQTAGITDTDTGERLPAYLFVAVLPYSGYAYILIMESGGRRPVTHHTGCSHRQHTGSIAEKSHRVKIHARVQQICRCPWFLCSPDSRYTSPVLHFLHHGFERGRSVALVHLPGPITEQVCGPPSQCTCT